ncbi:MAG TPA: rRNA maturation RNase YbeY [Armatimonadetes bacterium]|jgi:probable rRNA maturation factor|nr:rRNA maturation RNase YbeY [Armatimonadota bacterium]MCA1997167.1 rRNA maturation RNase YbeY [Armatimonadota bacterium]HCE01423.1 rRNA maturation RNase YbeY [Armatimonadota bacterium]
MDPDPRTKVSWARACRTRVPTALARSAFLRTLAERGLSGMVSVLWTDDEGIRELNARFRGLDEPTDVLTFPGPDFPGAPLGDVAISLETARRQAAVRGIPPEVETAYLAIHAALHLAGLRDETDEERKEMQAEMARLAALFGLPVDPEWTSLHGEGPQ